MQQIVKPEKQPNNKFAKAAGSALCSKGRSQLSSCNKKQESILREEHGNHIVCKFVISGVHHQNKKGTKQVATVLHETSGNVNHFLLFHLNAVRFGNERIKEKEVLNKMALRGTVAKNH